jgi:hypothetical protein
MTEAAAIATPSAIDRFMVLFLWLFVKVFSTRVPTATAIRKPRSTFRSSFVPADGTGAANYESGDFGTSPFFLGSSQASRGPPVCVYLWCREESTMVQREFMRN